MIHFVTTTEPLQMAKKLKSEADDHVNPFAGWLLPPDAELRPKLKNARSKVSPRFSLNKCTRQAHVAGQPSISAKSRSLVKMEDNDGASTSVKVSRNRVWYTYLNNTLYYLAAQTRRAE